VQQVDYTTAWGITFMIQAELAKKGLLKTDSDYADLYIGYQTALSRQTPGMAYHDGWGYGRVRRRIGRVSLRRPSTPVSSMWTCMRRQQKKTRVARRRVGRGRAQSKPRRK